MPNQNNSQNHNSKEFNDDIYKEILNIPKPSLSDEKNFNIQKP